MIRNRRTVRNSRGGYDARRMMSEMRKRRISRNRKAMNESRSVSRKRHFKESYYEKDIIKDIVDWMTEAFDGTTMDDVQDFMDNDFYEFINEFIDNQVMYYSDAMDIINSNNYYSWEDAESIIGYCPKSVTDVAVYAITDIVDSSDVYSKVEEALTDMIDENEYDYV